MTLKEATDKNIITKQVVINTPTSARLLPITADEKVIDEIQQALTSYEELERDVKRYFEIKNTIDKYERLNKKNEIPNELWVKFRYIKKAIMKLLKVGANE